MRVPGQNHADHAFLYGNRVTNFELGFVRAPCDGSTWCFIHLGLWSAKTKVTLSCLLHPAVFMMQAAQHTCLHDAVTGRQFVSVAAVRNVGLRGFRNSWA